MMRAVCDGVVLAEAPRTVRLEGNHYFPPGAVRRCFLVDSATRTRCPWKGLARYYSVVVEGRTHADAAWYYRTPGPLARRIKNHVAFGSAVRVLGEPDGERPGVSDRLRSSAGRARRWIGAARVGGQRKKSHSKG